MPATGVAISCTLPAVASSVAVDGVGFMPGVGLLLGCDKVPETCTCCPTEMSWIVNDPGCPCSLTIVPANGHGDLRREAELAAIARRISACAIKPLPITKVSPVRDSTVPSTLSSFGRPTRSSRPARWSP
jgi:uncharacterized protein YfcZ (UPF0381/DUF406 family)